MNNEFQLIVPGMHPFVSGIFSVILFLIAIIGCLLIYWAVKRISRQENSLVSMIPLTLGIISVSYVLINIMTYNGIFAAQEKRIIGEFYEDSSTIPLRVHADHTWTYKGKNLGCHSGRWEYIASEDWCYWNIESVEKGFCSVQTGDPKVIQFREKWFAFRKK